MREGWSSFGEEVGCMSRRYTVLLLSGGNRTACVRLDRQRQGLPNF